MSFKIIQRLILGIILVVLSFVLGAEAAEGTKTPILILLSLGLLFSINWLGRRAWVIIFIAPLVSIYLPLGSLHKLSPGYLASSAILGYYLILYMMGYVNLKWRKLWFFDSLIAIVFIIVLIHYIQRPVGVSGLGAVNGELGGREYLACLLATIFYIAVSLIPLPAERLAKLFKVLMFLSVLICVYGVTMGFFNIGIAGIESGMEGGRFATFMGSGRIFFLVLLCYYTPWQIVSSVWKCFVLGLSFILVVLSGFREQLGMLSFYFLFSCVVCRQMILFIVLSCTAYGTVLWMSHSELILDLPFGVQRALSVLPGVEVDAKVLAGADHSWNWRVVMWEQAMDPSTGYIKDYVWGDGFGFNLAEMRLVTIQRNRGMISSGAQDTFMESGKWHSGYITVIHRLGYIGLGIVGFTMLAFSLLALKVCSLYRLRAAGPAVLYSLIVLPGDVITFYISAGSFNKFFGMYFIFGLSKILYCSYREELEEKGQSIELAREKYVPMMLRDEPVGAQQK